MKESIDIYYHIDAEDVRKSYMACAVGHMKMDYNCRKDIAKIPRSGEDPLC